MERRGWPKAVMTVTLWAALALMIPTAASAGPPGESGAVDREPVLSAWVFWDGELIVLTGPPVEEGCLGEGFRFPTATVVDPPGGDSVTSVTHTDQVWVYDGEGVTDPLDWLFGLVCGAVTAGEPPPEPLAHGEGRVNLANGNLRVTAQVVTGDGQQVHLNVVSAGLDGFGDVINYGG